MTEETNQQEAFPLDESTIEMVQELGQQARDVQVSLQAILTAFLRRHKLQGPWKLAPNNREVVKQSQQAETIPQN